MGVLGGPAAPPPAKERASEERARRRRSSPLGLCARCSAAWARADAARTGCGPARLVAPARTHGIGLARGLDALASVGARDRDPATELDAPAPRRPVPAVHHSTSAAARRDTADSKVRGPHAASAREPAVRPAAALRSPPLCARRLLSDGPPAEQLVGSAAASTAAPAGAHLFRRPPAALFGTGCFFDAVVRGGAYVRSGAAAGAAAGP